MKPFSFIHTADLHLDSPFKRISKNSEHISSKLKQATFNAFESIINLCIDKKVDFLLVAGDVYDGADKILRAQLKFRDGMRKLSKSGIKAYIVHGNHDPLNGWSANLKWPENVYIFKGNEVENFECKKDGLTIAQIYGISYPTREIKKNLTEKFPVLSAKNTKPFTIGMLHCNLGTDTGHEPYAPCSLEDLISKNYDYWALGHVHKKTIIRDESPLIVYPGNIQGLNPRDTESKGCYLVEVDHNGLPNAEFVEVNSIRWFTKEIPINGINEEDELINVIEREKEIIREEVAVHSSICRLTLNGTSNLHSFISREGTLDGMINSFNENEINEEIFVWIDSIVNETRQNIAREVLKEREGFVGELIRSIDDTLTNNYEKKEFKECLNQLYNSKYKRYLEDIEDEKLNELIEKAEVLCLDALLGGSNEH